MSKKKTQPRKRTKTSTEMSAIAVPPQLTDPHLAALLSFIDGSRRDDYDGRFAAIYGRALAAADQMLTSLPVTSAFELHRDRPSIYEVICSAIEADIAATDTDPADTLRAFTSIQDAWHEDSVGERSVDDKDITNMMPSYIDHSVYVGACLMYRLLKGGAR